MHGGIQIAGSDEHIRELFVGWDNKTESLTGDFETAGNPRGIILYRERIPFPQF